MNILFGFLVVWGLGVGVDSFATTEYLVKFKQLNASINKTFISERGGILESVSSAGRLFKWTPPQNKQDVFFDEDELIEYMQPNYPIKLFQNPSLAKYDPGRLHEALVVNAAEGMTGAAFPDNPDFITLPVQVEGADPLLSASWGLHLIGASHAWTKTNQGRGIVVAVTDTGIDYTHLDLVRNLWTNTREVLGDGQDNDGNGFIDDIVGWDFVGNDNKPYDLSMKLFDIILGQGNPGHGTHVSGVIASQLKNGIGVAGVSPRAKLMGLRFINEKGQGDSAGAIKAIDYAVANGANIISASWGSEGEEPGDQAVREAIQRAESAGVLFVAAAGNGRLDPQSLSAAGYDNDRDSKPVYPASYPYSNIIAVSAINSSEQLAGFSNYGLQSVDLGAPGVKIMSTVPGNQFQDTILSFGELQITWDGTSMATPFVSGALAVIWGENSNLNSQEVKDRLLRMVTAVQGLSGKVLTGARLDIHGLR